MSIKHLVATALVVLSLMSCGVNESGKNEILDKYASWGSPTNVEIEESPAVTFYTYTWDTSAGHAELVISYADRSWSEVRFNSY